MTTPDRTTRTSRPTRRALRLLVAGLGAGLALAISATPASAHDEILSTSPADGQTVDRTPSSLVLTFAEPAIELGTQVVVTGPAGDATSGAPRLVGSTVVQDLQPGAPAGAYRVTWRVTSDDGHPVSGTFAFSATAAGTGSAASGTASPTPAESPAASASAPTATAAPASTTGSPAPAAPARREPLIPGWGWIGAGVLIIIGAVRVARRNRAS